MQLIWIEYPNQHENEIETWCDEFAVCFALDDNSVKAEHQWYLNSDKYTHNKNYFCKVVLDGNVPVALLMVAVFEDAMKTHLHERIVYLDTLIINPAVRGQGYGTRVVADFLQNANEIIGVGHYIFVSQVHKDNDIAKKLCTKLGFGLTCNEENSDWIDWVFPASAADRYTDLDLQKVVTI